LEEGLACSAAVYADTKSHQANLREQTEAMLADGTILLTPAETGPAPDAATTGNPAFNSPWSYTGLPTVSLPTGQFVEGLPLAIQLVGRRGAEARLIEVGQWCERALGVGPLAAGS
jgi:aspartyl-tRNA(Asn)/glutamyl-tRNA(Gln) amidotransferase subunit A